MVTECNRHFDHSYVIRCAHFGNASVTMRDYHYPDYVARYRVQSPLRFGVFGLQERPFMLLVDVETNDRDVADAAFRDAVAQMAGVEVAL